MPIEKLSASAISTPQPASSEIVGATAATSLVDTISAEPSAELVRHRWSAQPSGSALGAPRSMSAESDVSRRSNRFARISVRPRGSRGNSNLFSTGRDSTVAVRSRAETGMRTNGGGGDESGSGARMSWSQLAQ